MQKEEFIEQRRAALEKYLARLAAHPVLRHSDELVKFLQTEAEIWLKGQQEVSEVMGDLGLAFFKLAKFETEYTTVSCQRLFAADVKHTATAAVKASRYYRESNEFSVKHLDELHEYLGLMQALHTAFADHYNALITVQTLTQDVASLDKQIAKLVVASSKIFGGGESQNRKIEELKEQMKNTEEACQLAHKQYDQIQDRNKSELDRIKVDH